MPGPKLARAVGGGEPPQALAVADALRDEADQVLYATGLDPLLRSYGTVAYTGSYRLDVMAWPDIDVQMVLEPDPRSVNAFFELGRGIARLEGVFRLHFRNLHRSPLDGFPRALYWGIRLDAGTPATTWKLDLWATEADDFEANAALMARFEDAMDAQARRRIVETKLALLTPEGRTPVLSGVHIYEAILFRGLRALDDIRAYLREQGVEGV